MRKSAALQEVDPLALPLGTRVGPWRVSGFRGRGAYGTLYRAEREGREAEGSCALKLAVYPGDEGKQCVGEVEGWKGLADGLRSGY